MGVLIMQFSPCLVCFPNPILRHVSSVLSLGWEGSLFTWNLVWRLSPCWAVLWHALCPITEDNPSIATGGAATTTPSCPMAWSLCASMALYPRAEMLGLGFPFFLGNYFFPVQSKEDQNIWKSHIQSRVRGGAGKHPVSGWLNISSMDIPRSLTLQSLCPLRFKEDQLKFLYHFCWEISTAPNILCYLFSFTILLVTFGFHFQCPSKSQSPFHSLPFGHAIPSPYYPIDFVLNSTQAFDLGGHAFQMHSHEVTALSSLDCDQRETDRCHVKVYLLLS